MPSLFWYDICLSCFGMTDAVCCDMTDSRSVWVWQTPVLFWYDRYYVCCDMTYASSVLVWQTLCLFWNDICQVCLGIMTGLDMTVTTIKVSYIPITHGTLVCNEIRVIQQQLIWRWIGVIWGSLIGRLLTRTHGVGAQSVGSYRMAWYMSRQCWQVGFKCGGQARSGRVEHAVSYNDRV